MHWYRISASLVSVTDEKLELIISRLSIAGAIFGGTCNLSSLLLSFYEDYCRQLQFVWSWGLILLVVISLMPLLVLFILRDRPLIVFIYAPVLVWILVQRVDRLREYCYFSRISTFHKYDEPSVFLLFLGMISAVVVLVWAAIRGVAFIRREPKLDRAEL